ncbi:MAG: hypothetical protein FWF31_08215, partial [Desulfobulbus sp.]|nr:hypothetical protein [Desulfobulbus sp.]
MAKELDSLGFTGTARNTAAGLMPKARESAMESLGQARDENSKRRLAKHHDEARDELREDPVYRAHSDMRKTPLDLQAVRDNYGDEAIFIFFIAASKNVAPRAAQGRIVGWCFGHFSAIPSLILQLL